MPHTRSFSAGYLPVPTSSTITKDIILLTDEDPHDVQPFKTPHPTLTDSRTPSQRSTYYDELLAKDFSKQQYSKEKYCEYCKSLQVLGRELRAENDKLRADAAAVVSPGASTPSIRRPTDETENSQKKLLSVPRDEVVVVFSSADNSLKTIKGHALNANYTPLTLPSFHWWNDSLHLYFSNPGDPKASPSKQPFIIVSRKKLQPTYNQDLKFARTIKLSKLGFSLRWRRWVGRLKTMYVLDHEPLGARSSEMTMSNSAS